jgi:hypothetical protein
MTLPRERHYTMKGRSIARALAIISLFACSDSSGPGSASVTSLDIRSGDGQVAFAGAPVSQPVLIVPVDASGATVSGQTASFTVTSGGGVLASTTAQAGADGAIRLPAWTLGRSALPQTIQVSVGEATATVAAVVWTELEIDIRFFGETLTPDQRALYTDAIARIRAAVVGPLGTADLSGVGPAPCGISELPAPTGTTNGIVIYAGAKFLDGVDGALGYGGICNARSATDPRTAIGLIVMDMADINSTPRDMPIVALHELFHVLGFGYWQQRGLLTGYNTLSVAYTGAGGVAGCKAIGGVQTCASAVPVQNVVEAGANAHWRDQVFGTELMTASFKISPLLSVMTIRSLEDLGYVVNPLAADAYLIPSANGTLQTAPSRAAGWESTFQRPALPLP